jgi:nickel transport protein
MPFQDHMRTRMLLAATLVAAPALAAAHDLWVERSTDGFVVRYGHHGGALLPLDTAKVKAIRCADETGAVRELRAAARAAPTEVSVTAACATISAFLDGGFWSLTPDGEVNLPKDQAGSAVKSWASRQYAKWVDARSPRAGAVLGDELELVPVSDLAKAREGDKVTLRVLSGGRPVRDAVVAVEHRSIGDTDSKGEIRLRLRRTGVESISTSVRRAHPTPQTDTEVLEATLTFEVGK